MGREVPAVASQALAPLAPRRGREIVAFYLLSLALSWPAMLLWNLPENFVVGDATAAREAYARVGMFFGLGPMVAALIVAVAFGGAAGARELLRRLGIVRIAPVWYLAPLLVVIVPQWAGAGAWKVLIGGDLAPPEFTEWLVRLLPLVVANGAFSIGEELGWRGLMLPRVLAHRSWLTASLMVGAAWAVWHYPLWFAINVAVTGSVVTTTLILLLVSIMGLAFSVLLTWIFSNTRGSLLPPLLFHGAINANMNLIYEGMSDKALSSVSLLMCTTVATVLMAGLIVVYAARGKDAPQTVPAFRPR